MAVNNFRLRELDFLRGIAIILVLFRHEHLFDFTSKMGAFGVDLFFVLSGFLVSGLLFREYLKFGDIKPGLFLVRRGFKIYPVYYLFYIVHLSQKIIKRQFEVKGFLSDMFFVQNYTWNWGYAFSPSWTLAVEEHFYFGFAMLLFLGLHYHWVNLNKVTSGKMSRFEWFVVLGMVGATALRVQANIEYPNRLAWNTSMTHLRIDSLLAGVMVSYWYYFRREWLFRFFNTHRKLLLFVAFAFMSFTPFVERDTSFFVKTYGYVLLYIAFGILLWWFLVEKQINQQLDRYLSKPVVDNIGKIGVASYSIYYIHSFVNNTYNMVEVFVLHYSFPQPITFFVTNAISIAVGIWMTNYVEKYFLAIRDRRYPSRSGVQIK
jgi:peptidoglycan/LPS O-acetylase OafA/YrhL